MDDKDALIPAAKPKPKRPEDDPAFNWKETPLARDKAGMPREMELDYQASTAKDPLQEPASVTLGAQPTSFEEILGDHVFTLNFEASPEPSPAPRPRREPPPRHPPPTRPAPQAQQAPEPSTETWQLTDNVGQIEAIFEAPAGQVPADAVRARLSDVQDITEVAPGVCTVRLTTGKFKRLRLCSAGDAR